MDANAVARFDPPNGGPNFVHDTCNLVSQRERQPRDRRHPGAIMSVGMTNASGANANQGIGRPQNGNLDPLLFKRRTNRR
jgi:hypothetical protein